MNKVLKRYVYKVDSVEFGEKSKLENGHLTISKRELQEAVQPLFEHVKSVDFELVKPGSDTRIIHLLDTILPMIKRTDESGRVYSGFFSDPYMVGTGSTNVMSGLAVMESCALPWDEDSASSGLLYPRDAILDMQGPIAGMTPFSETNNLVILYELEEGRSSAEYDDEIRYIGLRVAMTLAELTLGHPADYIETYTIDEVDPELPNVVLVWQCQNQGPYANTLLYGVPIDDIVPTLLHPNEMLDGAVVSGNYVWPAFKVPTYSHVNHPILLELYRLHGLELNFRGVIFCRSHNPTNWHKLRNANMCVKLAEYLDADGLIMAWEGGGNAAVDGMLTIQTAEKHGIKCSTITFEFGGQDGSEGVLLVDDVPEADAVISGGSIEKAVTLPQVSRVVGGDVMRLNKETGGFFPPADEPITFEQTIHFYMSGNQCGASKLSAVEY